MNYVWTILAAVITTFLFKSKILPLSKTMFLFDSIGLGVFTLLGLQKGLTYELHPIVALIMGMIFARGIDAKKKSLAGYLVLTVAVLVVQLLFVLNQLLL